MTDRVIVVGAGVVGLSCAVRLLEAGHRVDVVARELPLETTSSVAAAIWYPYLALPRELVTAWGRTAYDEFACGCGAARCRGRVSGDDWRLPELRERYAGYFSAYLQRRIDAERA